MDFLAQVAGRLYFGTPSGILGMIATQTEISITNDRFGTVGVYIVGHVATHCLFF